MNFVEKLSAAQSRNHSWLCVGLDPLAARLPAKLRAADDPLFEFCRAIVDATADLVCAFKPNLAFFLSEGSRGVGALERVLRCIPGDIPIILDAKLGDIGSSAEQYARAAYEAFGADAVTVQPYIGGDSVRPFLQYADRGVFLLARTSNPGATDFQDLLVEGRPLFAQVAARAQAWHAVGPGACGLVVGATYPADLERLRALAPDLPFLIPGVGAQGGDLGAAVRFGPTAQGLGPAISASRAVLYASQGEDFASAARAEAERLRAGIGRVSGFGTRDSGRQRAAPESQGPG